MTLRRTLTWKNLVSYILLPTWFQGDMKPFGSFEYCMSKTVAGVDSCLPVIGASALRDLVSGGTKMLWSHLTVEASGSNGCTKCQTGHTIPDWTSLTIHCPRTVRRLSTCCTGCQVGAKTDIGTSGAAQSVLVITLTVLWLKH